MKRVNDLATRSKTDQNRPKKVGEPGFVHSLFRSGSTYFYNALKRVEGFTPYHEPFHEVIGELTSSWDDLVGRTGEFKALLRHDFLHGGYFDEYSHLLPYLKKAFNQDVSYATFFLEKDSECLAVKAYVDCLITGAQSRPVFQCTRTVGRIEWLRNTYGGTHLYLLRNPWDQWFSYMVDPYIASTTQLIYSQPRLPDVLRDVSEASGFTPLGAASLGEMATAYMKRPLTPQVDYFLFFGLWVYAFLNGESNCDLVIDMDELTESGGAVEGLQGRLSNLGFGGLRFNDCTLHRGTFRSDEAVFYRQIEGRVLEIFRRSKYLCNNLPRVEGYLNRRRAEVFVAVDQARATSEMALEDSVRARRRLLLLMKDNAHQLAESNINARALENHIGKLDADVFQRDQRISDFNHSVHERDVRINKLHQEIAEKGSVIIGLRHEASQTKATLTKLHERITRLDDAVAESNLRNSRGDQTVLKLEARIDALIASRDAEIASSVQAISDQSARIARLEKLLSEREATLVEREEKINDMTTVISSRGEQVSILALKIIERDSEFLSFWRTTANLGESLREREATIMSLSQKVCSLKLEVGVFDERMQCVKSESLALSKALGERDHHIVRLKRKLVAHAIENTRLSQVVANHFDKLLLVNERSKTTEAEISERDGRILEGEMDRAVLSKELINLSSQIASLKLVGRIQRDSLYLERRTNVQLGGVLKTVLVELDSIKGGRFRRVIASLKRLFSWF